MFFFLTAKLFHVFFKKRKMSFASSALENFNTNIHLQNRLFSGTRQMAAKNAILRHIPYNAVQQAVSKMAALLPRNWGPATLLLGPHYHAMEAPLRLNGGPITMQRRLGCEDTEMPLPHTEAMALCCVAHISTTGRFLPL